MRLGHAHTRLFLRLALPAAAVGLCTLGTIAAEPAQTRNAPAPHPGPTTAPAATQPAGQTRELARIDAELAEHHAARAWTLIQQLDPRTAETPAVAWRAARALFDLDRPLGDPQVQSVPGGRPGQFVNDAFVVAARGNAEQFLCCGRDAALFQVRRALDAGLDEPAAHVLHARIWLRIGAADAGWAILRSRAGTLLARPDADTLRAYCELALAVGEIQPYMHYSRLLAERVPEQRDAVLASACMDVADYYNQHGDKDLCSAWLSRAGTYPQLPARVLLRLADACAAAEPERAAEFDRAFLRAFPRDPEAPRVRQRLDRTGRN